MFCALSLYALILVGQPGIYSEGDIEIQNLYMDAQSAKFKGDTDKQIELLKKLIGKSPQSDGAFYDLARAFYTKNDLEQARKFGEKALGLNPDNVWYAVAMTEIYEKSTQYEDAIVLLRKLIQQDQANDTFYYRLAYNLLKSRNPEEAVNVLENLEKIKGISEESTKRKFEILSKTGKSDAAVEALRQLCHAYPDEVSYLSNLAIYLDDLGHKEESDAVFRQILELDPDHAAANIALVTRKNDKKNKTGFLEGFDAIVQNMSIPLDDKIKEIIPFIATMKGRGDRQSLFLDTISTQLVRLYPNEAKTHALRGDVLYNMGDVENSEKSYANAIERNDNIFSVWEQWLKTLWELGQYQKLAAQAENALDLFPNKFGCYFMYGVVLVETGKFDEAMYILEEATLVSGSLRENIILLKIAQALLSVRNGDNKKALKYIADLNLQEIQDPMGLELAGDIYAVLGQSKKSAEAYQKALFLGANATRINRKIDQ